MKTSFITTVFNEEKTIGSLLQSIAKQSILPSEVIIVDANSIDETQNIVKSFFSKHRNLHGRLIIKKSNRSVGRNAAISKAKYQIILASDAGCMLENHWVENISKPFQDKKIDIVSGYYSPVAKNIFQKALSTYTSVMPDKIDPNNFLPSTRSIAFRKNVWQKVKGFPENLQTCEDMIFDKKAKQKGFTFFFEKKAIVYWPQRKNLLEAFEQFFNYSLGDGLAHYFRPQIPFLFLRYFIGISILIIGLFISSTLILISCLFFLVIYMLWAIKKNYKYVKNWKAIFYLPLLQFASDIAVIAGTSIGLLKTF